MTQVRRGDIWMADLGYWEPRLGHEQRGTRPVLIIQNDVGNKFAPTTIVAPISTARKKPLPTHVSFFGGGLQDESVVLLEQIRTVDKRYLVRKMGVLPDEVMSQIEQAILISLGMEGGENSVRTD